MKKALPFIALTASAFAQNPCVPTAPTCYTPDDCQRCYCLGPSNIIANAPVCPYTCDGDLTVTVAGFYWKADQDGLEYAVDDSVTFPGTDSSSAAFRQLKNLIDAQYLTPDFKWDFGFKVGVAYCSSCDGWDIGLLWTSYRGKASSHDVAEPNDNHTLLPIWSAFQFGRSNSSVTTNPIANEIQTSWHLDLDLIDIELGRAFWVSHYLSLRPHIGLRMGFLDQSFHLDHKGGTYVVTSDELVANDTVELNNDFKGVGVRGGVDTNWHLGCGWSLYGNLATSIVYGKFDVDHNEYIRQAVTPFTKITILDTADHFRASRGMLDLGLGVQWMGMVCDCKYGLLVALGWEQHLFFHQNQMWRVNRLVPTRNTLTGQTLNNSGENDYFQRRGTLSTEGVTLKVSFTF